MSGLYCRYVLETVLKPEPLIDECWRQAILTANHDAIDYQRIKSSISAILFFGTPHPGADLASLAQIFTKIYSVANYPISGLVGSTRTDLVSNLEKDSPLLTEMAMDIRNQLTEIKIASFVEMANTLPFNTVVSIFIWSHLS